MPLSINSITIDGKRGLYKAFEDYPIQNVSLSSEEAPKGISDGIIQRYINKHPKLQANKDLQKILLRLTSTNETIFIKSIDAWYETHKDF